MQIHSPCSVWTINALKICSQLLVETKQGWKGSTNFSWERKCVVFLKIGHFMAYTNYGNLCKNVRPHQELEFGRIEKICPSKVFFEALYKYIRMISFLIVGLKPGNLLRSTSAQVFQIKHLLNTSTWISGIGMSQGIHFRQNTSLQMVNGSHFIEISSTEW